MVQVVIQCQITTQPCPIAKWVDMRVKTCAVPSAPVDGSYSTENQNLVANKAAIHRACAQHTELISNAFVPLNSKMCASSAK